MAGTGDTLRASTSVPSKNKRRSVNRSRRKAVGNKIRKLRKEGKKQSQAVAIANSMKRRGEL